MVKTEKLQVKPSFRWPRSFRGQRKATIPARQSNHEDKALTTPAQIEANRKNARRSTGGLVRRGIAMVAAHAKYPTAKLR